MDIIKPQIALSDISLFADHRLFMLWDVNNVFPEILLPSTSLFFFVRVYNIAYGDTKPDIVF